MNQSPAPAPTTSGAQRLLSLDALRGFDMFWIVGAASLVEALDKMNHGPVTKFLTTQLSHIQWAGFHFYDLIFPMFVFIAGVSLTFSLSKSLAQHGMAGAIRRLGRRCLLLVLAGLFYYGGLTNPWPNIRLLGVLQYIGLASFFGGSLYLLYMHRPLVLVGSCVAILAVYWILMACVPFPDVRLDKNSVATLAAKVKSQDPAVICRAVTNRVHGVYEEGHNLANYLDYRYLPGLKKREYGDGTWEAQGLLGIMTVTAECLLGILAGLWLRRSDIRDGRKVVGLLIVGVLSTICGFALGHYLPVVKKIWSSTFVLVAGGYSAILLACFYLVVDVWKWQTWCQPFVWIGMNPITIYLAYNIIEFPKIAQRFAGGNVQAWLDVHIAKGAGGILLTAIELSLTFLLVRFLYVRKIFIRL